MKLEISKLKDETGVIEILGLKCTHQKPKVTVRSSKFKDKSGIIKTQGLKWSDQN
jgi:hypothetical protein